MRRVTTKRIKRSSDTIRGLILEAEKSGTAADICRREGIAPSQFYAWRRKARLGLLPGTKSGEVSETQPDRLALDALVNQLCVVAVELQQLKRRMLGEVQGSKPALRIRRHTRTYRNATR